MFLLHNSAIVAQKLQRGERRVVSFGAQVDGERIGDVDDVIALQ